MTAEPYADAAAAEDPQKSGLLALMTKHGARRKGHRHQIIPHHLDLMRVEALEQFDTVKGDLFEFRAPHLGEDLLFPPFESSIEISEDCRRARGPGERLEQIEVGRRQMAEQRLFFRARAVESACCNAPTAEISISATCRKSSTTILALPNRSSISAQRSSALPKNMTPSSSRTIRRWPERRRSSTSRSGRTRRENSVSPRCRRRTSGRLMSTMKIRHEKPIPVSKPAVTDQYAVIVITAATIARFFHAVRLGLRSRRKSVSRSSRKLQRSKLRKLIVRRMAHSTDKGIAANSAGSRMPSANSADAVVN